MIRTDVSFTADLPDDSAAVAPEALATWLVNRLGEKGRSCSLPHNLDYGYAFRAVVEARSFYVIVGLVEDGVRQWLVSVSSGLSWFQRLLRKTDTGECAQLLDDLHAILSSEQGVNDVRWYTPDGWSESPESSWAPTPRE